MGLNFCSPLEEEQGRCVLLPWCTCRKTPAPSLTVFLHRLHQVHKKLADGTFGAEEAGADGGLKTSGSRAMDAYRMKQTGAAATYDPTRGGAQVCRVSVVPQNDTIFSVTTGVLLVISMEHRKYM